MKEKIANWLRNIADKLHPTAYIIPHRMEVRGTLHKRTVRMVAGNKNSVIYAKNLKAISEELAKELKFEGLIKFGEYWSGDILFYTATILVADPKEYDLL